jgi:hypothetical protein
MQQRARKHYRITGGRPVGQRAEFGEGKIAALIFVGVQVDGDGELPVGRTAVQIVAVKKPPLSS